MPDDKLDLAVVGAGPCGLSAAIAATQAGLNAAVFDKGCIARSITLYPTYATFFSTADRLEVGGVPFIAAGDKPTRGEALKYYRRVASEFELDVRQYREVTGVDGEKDAFTLEGFMDYFVDPATACAKRGEVKGFITGTEDDLASPIEMEFVEKSGKFLALVEDFCAGTCESGVEIELPECGPSL